MPQLISLLRVFVSSPSDVTPERRIVEDVIDELNLSLSRVPTLRLELVKWETHTFPTIGAEPQTLINEQIGDEYDIFLGLMWARFGTQTAMAGSGTEEEFNRAYDRYIQNPNQLRILFYFKDAPVTPDVDVKQLSAVQQFRSRLKEQGLIGNFRNPEELARNLRIHLRRHLDEFGKSWGVTLQPTQTGEPAVSDSDGQIKITASKKAFARINTDLPDFRKSFVVSYPIIEGLESEEVVERINSVLSFERVFDISLKDEIDSGGLTDLDFEVDFLQSPFLVITLMIQGVGAYAWYHSQTIVIDLLTGREVRPTDIFRESLLAELAERVNKIFLLDKQKAELILAYELGDGQFENERHHLEFVPKQFSVEDLNHFSLNDVGITFKFSFNYPHVIKAYEPSGEYEFSYSALSPFIKPGGILDQFVNHN